MQTTKNSAADSLSVLGHLDELRRRLFYCLGYLLAGAVIGLFFAKPLIAFLKLPAAGLITDFVVLKPTEIVGVYMKVALYAGALLALPGILHQAWLFIRPAVKDDLPFRPFPWVLSAAGLFLAGTCFAFKVLLPSGLRFLMEIAGGLATPMITLGGYVSFVLSVLVLGGGIFEMPVLAALLTRLGLLTPSFMRRKRREAIFALCALAAVLTPTTDIFNMLLFVAPMLALYEVSILVSAVIQNSKRKEGSTDPYVEELERVS